MMATMLHYPRDRHSTITTHVPFPTTAAGVTQAWMHQVCRKGCEDHNLALEERSLSRWFNVPRPNIINYSHLLLEGKAIYVGAACREDLVASRLNSHRTDTFGVRVSASVSFAFINTNPNTKILDIEKEAVMAAASPLPAAALTNFEKSFGKGCQPGTCAVGSAVYLMIPLRDSEDRDVYPVPAGGIRDVTAPNLRRNGQDAYSTGTDAYSTGTDAYSTGQDAFSLGTDAHTLGTSAYATGTARPNGRAPNSWCKHCKHYHGRHHPACEASKEEKRNSKKRRRSD